jgi:hypothetical protein
VTADQWRCLRHPQWIMDTSPSEFLMVCLEIQVIFSYKIKLSIKWEVVLSYSGRGVCGLSRTLRLLKDWSRRSVPRRKTQWIYLSNRLSRHALWKQGAPTSTNCCECLKSLEILAPD